MFTLALYALAYGFFAFWGVAGWKMIDQLGDDFEPRRRSWFNVLNPMYALNGVCFVAFYAILQYRCWVAKAPPFDR